MFHLDITRICKLERSLLFCMHDRAGPRSGFWPCTAQGHEIDLLIDLGAKKIPFEIKPRCAPTANDAVVLRQCLQQLQLTQGYLIHSGRENYSLGNGVTALSAEQILSRPQTLLR